MHETTIQATPPLDTYQIQCRYLSYYGGVSDASRLKWAPRESVTHQDQVLIHRRRKKPGRVARPPAKCCARRGNRVPGFFCLRLKRSPVSRGSVVYAERQPRQHHESHQPTVQVQITKEAGQR